MARVKFFANFSLVFYFYCVCSGINGQSIKFENGRYNGIVIGIDGDKIKAEDCGTIRQNLELILAELSKSLREATSGRAEIGQVDILLPFTWNTAACGAQNILPASILHSYENSHFQITTDHPLAETLPWTKQYKPCMHGGDSIVFPMSFVNNSMRFSESIRGKMALAEWAKYRYGVFDEIGYATDDESFPACYTKDKQAYISTCTSVQLPAIAEKASACSMEFLIKHKENMINYMIQGPTSVLSAPFIDQSSTNHFCDASTHNPWTDTKHNIYCERKSVSEIINQHPDFKNIQHQQLEPGEITIRLLKHERVHSPAYAFIIEDSQDMRETNKILHVKQAIAQFLEILNDGVEVQIFIFSGDNVIDSKANQLNGRESRKEMLNFIPDVNSQPAPGIWNGDLTHVIDYFRRTLSAPWIYSWNVFLLTSSSSHVGDMNLAINRFQETNYSISPITFDSGYESNEKEWLKWYGIQNTRSVIALPYCRSTASQGLCSLRISSLIVEYFTSQLNSQQFGPRLVQKTNEVELQNTRGYSTIFNLDGDPSAVKKLYILISIPQNITTPLNFITVTPPQGDTNACPPEQLFEYGYVLKFHGNACAFVAGSWTVRVNERISSDSNINTLFLTVFQEVNDQTNFNILPSLGHQELTQELKPNSQLTPIFVSVSTKHGNPVLSASVSLQIYHPGLATVNDSLSGAVIVLKDDGDSNNGADQTANDGVYSAYLAGYSTTASSFHLGAVQVLINGNSKILNKIQSPRATYLHEQMTGKCCGKHIEPLETNSTLQHFTFRTLLPGFKTVEPWRNARLQPGRIGSISVSGEDDYKISVQFPRVAGDINDPSVNVESFQACCVPENITETPPAPTSQDCRPETTKITSQEPDFQQSVEMDKKALVQIFIPVELDRLSVDSLQCALRAVNTNSEFGLLSTTLVKVDVTAVVRGGGSGDEPKCDSISDDCLPILIFWILIGCVGLLVLLLVIALIVCCCCLSKNKEKSSKEVERKRNDMETRSPHLDNHVTNKYDKSPTNNSALNANNVPIAKDEPKVVKELFVNHAYIQDGDGEIKIIADSGEILRKPLNNSPPPNTSMGGGGHDVMLSPPRFKRNIQITRPPPQEEQVAMELSPDMQIFKPEPYPHPNNSSSKQRHPPRQNLKSRQPHHQHQRPEIIHANPMLRSDSVQTIPQHQPHILSSPPPRQDPDPTIYATVSRVSRMKPNNNYVEPSTTSPPTKSVPDPHYMVPHNSLPRMVQQRSRDPIPPQFQPYPSSASDSTMHSPIQSQRRPPRFTKPPPYPAGSQMMSRPQSGQSHHSTFSGGQNLSTPTRINPVPVQAPVPPPRFGSSLRQSPGVLQSFAAQRGMSSDEDSDQWDNEVDFDQGYSYA